jgi:competence protein ComEC
LSHPAVPPRVAWPWLAVAAAVWVVASVVAPDEEPDAHPPGPLVVEATMVGDVIRGRFGPYALAETADWIVLLDLSSTETPGLTVGDRVRVEGVANGRAGRARGMWHSSAVDVRTITRIEGAATPHLAVGNAVRRRVLERLEPFDDGRALVAGFLIGDTNELDPADVEAMRLSGLSHFVAVSGSNVALFLGLLAIAAGPFALGPRRRAVVGLLGLPVYVAATRFEPSVLRASVMAAIALGGRAVGLVLEVWQLLAAAVVILLVLEPGLTGSVGFQLSVAATGGVLIGGRWPLQGGRVARALAITLGAQVAVAPLLIAHFGSVPVFSPLVNLVAAPLVAASTLIGAIGVAGPRLLVDLAAMLAEAVLILARGSSTWPQVQAGALAAGGAGALGLWRVRALRLPGAVAASVAVVVMVLPGSATLPDQGAVVLDVGQGDAILLHGGGGVFALVDGGPDPVVLMGKLSTYGVTRLDLVVATHVHADHVAGLTGVVGELAVGEIWAAFHPHETGSSREFVEMVSRWGIPMSAPRPGEIRQLGGLMIEVVAPLRRYKGPNDQSIVLMVRGAGRSMLLSGDIEVVAQAELTGLRADVLKVPHQGAATSDAHWLRSVGAELAIISVGPNQFGHPADWVVDTLTESGARVLRTDHEGDVRVDLETAPNLPP